MADSCLSKRLVAALVLLAIVAATCVSLGNWQLDRAAERDAIAEAIQQGKESGGLLINARAAPEQLQDWRPAHATGTWLPEVTVLLDNRHYNGRPGLTVGSPLPPDEGPALALAVLIGRLAAAPSRPRRHPARSLSPSRIADRLRPDIGSRATTL